MKKLLPVVIALIGLGGGIVGGTMFKPAPPAEEHAPKDVAAGHGEDHGKDDHGKHAKADAYDGSAGYDGGHDDHGEHGEKKDAYVYVGLEKPFFAPVARNSGSNALARIDIHLEVPESLKEAAQKHEPKLRDAFLRAVLDFSEHGGFSRVRVGEGFDVLRDDLLVSARGVLGPKVRSVLIGEILTREG